MNAVIPLPRFSIDDYMAWEAKQSERHEYLRGEVFAMTGARDAHNTPYQLNVPCPGHGKICRRSLSMHR